MSKKGDAPKANTALRFGRRGTTLSTGLVGLPNVGKSSLYVLLTQHQVPCENYPFCTIDPTTARCAVPDTRYDELCSRWNPASRYPALLSVTDIAGLVKGASTGAGLGNAFLSHIQAVDSIVHVVRAFNNDEVVHVEDSIDPIRDLDTIINELCRKDEAHLSACEAAAVKDVKSSQGMKLPLRFFTVLEKMRALLAANKPVRDGDYDGPEVATINEKFGGLITTKPISYVVNLDAQSYMARKSKWLAPITAWVAEHGGGAIIPLSVEFEAKLQSLQGDDAAVAAYTQGAKSALPRLITNSYNDLELIVRVWWWWFGDCMECPCSSHPPPLSALFHDGRKGGSRVEHPKGGVRAGSGRCDSL